MDGISNDAKKIRAFLIGQLGKNASIQNNPINLESILNEIYGVLKDAQELIGGRLIILECEDNPNLITHYEKHGFKLIEEQKNEASSDQNNKLRTMYISISG